MKFPELENWELEVPGTWELRNLGPLEHRNLGTCLRVSVFLRHLQRMVPQPFKHWHEIISMQAFGTGSIVIKIGESLPSVMLHPNVSACGSCLTIQPRTLYKLVMPRLKTLYLSSNGSHVRIKFGGLNLINHGPKQIMLKCSWVYAYHTCTST